PLVRRDQARCRRPGARLRRCRRRVPARGAAPATGGDGRARGRVPVRHPRRGARRAGGACGGEDLRELRRRRRPARPAPAGRPGHIPARAPARRHPRPRARRRPRSHPVSETPSSESRLQRLGSLRTLWPFLARHRGLFVAWLFALALSSAATLSLPVAVRHMIDRGFSGGESINQAFAVLFVVAVALALATAARFFFVSLLGERVVADLRQRLYGHLIGLDPAFHDRSRSGELVSRLSADAELLRSVIG